MDMKRQIIAIYLCCMGLLCTHAAATLYPIDVQKSKTQTGYAIEKIYEVSAQQSPDEIPKAAFELDGVTYQFVELLREASIPQTDMQEQTQTLTVTSKSKEWDELLSILPTEKAYQSDDGYMGTLKLDPNSIKTEIAGYGESTKTVHITHKYTGLANADLQNIPKTIVSNGITYTLSDTQWQVENVQAIDDFPIADRYTAIATYKGTQTSSYVKGYNVTASYTGVVSKTYIPTVRYTAIFQGQEPEQTQEPEQNPIHPVTEKRTKTQDLEPETSEAIGDSWRVGFLILGIVGLVLLGILLDIKMWRKWKEKSYDVQMEKDSTDESDMLLDDEQFPGISDTNLHD